MPDHPHALRRPTDVLAIAIVMVVCAIAPASGQQGCRFGEGGNDVLDQRTVPGGGTVTYVTRPHFVCDDGVQIWADSAVAYSADALSHLIGRVRYLDRSRELTASEARYFSNVGRLQASGRVVVINRQDGSRVENGDLVYLRRTTYRPDESMTVTTGRDGLRPYATVTPQRSDSTGAGGRPARPYTVVGDRIVFVGSSYFNSTGSVEIQRDSLFAFADSAEYRGAAEQLVLVGSARVVSSSYDLLGGTITIGTADTGPNEVRAVEQAMLTGDDLLVRAPEIRMYILDDRVERLVAVPLAPGAAAAATTDAGIPSDSTTRPVAAAEAFELTADSLELTAPNEVVERIFAGGRARSVSQARDSLNVEALPPIARTDWLEGDTIVITLVPRPGRADAPEAVADVAIDSATLVVGGRDRGYEVERIVARVNARSLYRLPPEDSTARAGIDAPAVHYVVGDEITILMRDGEVEAMEVAGQTRGVHLEPLGRAQPDDPPAAPDLAPNGVPGPPAPTLPLRGGRR